ncbi:MAG: hypothetical protein IJL12_01480 [Selenomonadaceae bacterium]|nr:hypothetical protein [Selenomonadaceae bacterium]
MNEYLRLDQIYRGSCMKFEDATCERLKDKKCLEYYGFKVYSQNDEDGIIEEIFNRVGTTNKIFIEFGVENGLECNSHYLLHKGWRGLWIDGGHEEEIQERFAPVIADDRLKFLQAFITRENINELFIKCGVTGEIDLLSIDIDGNDYHVWQAINVVKPRVVVIEYNAKFPPNCDWKQAYNKRHKWDDSDWQGASLKALELLGRQLGYQLVGTNLNGVNAFFVRKDLAKNLFIEPATAENLYNPARFHISYTNGHPPRYCLAVQHENFGLLDYKPKCDAIPLSGFYGEMRNGDLKFNLMSGKKSSILVRNKEKIVLPYFLPNHEADNLSLKITDEGGGTLTIPIQQNGLLEMNPPPSAEPLELTLEISRTFTDTQGKIFGLAIIFEVR